MRAAIYSPIQELCLCWPSDWTLPAPGIIIPVTYPAALMPLECIANLNDARLYSYLITLHYIFSYLWCENRIYNKFKEFDLCELLSNVKSSFVFYLIFYTILFLTNLASTGGPHEISRRAAGWTALG